MEGLSVQQQAASAVAACAAQIQAQSHLAQDSITSLNVAEGLHCAPQEISAAQLQAQLEQAHSELAEYKGYLAEVSKGLQVQILFLMLH
jgi:hypothetical protein